MDVFIMQTMCRAVLALLSLSCVAQADEYGFAEPYPEVYEKIQIRPYFMHGWNRYEVEFDPLLAERKFNTVIEVGVFLGNLTAYIAPKLPKGARYFAIDHWKGSEEHHIQGTIEYECVKNMYAQFLSNMIHLGLTKTVVPVRMPSLAAANKFKQLGIKADLIYIDAAHDYIAVYQDLVAWFPLLAPGGVFCGDDWHYHGVRIAVQQFAEKKGLSIYTNGNYWRFMPPN